VVRFSTGHMLEDILSSLFPRVCPLCRKRLLAPEQGFCEDCYTTFPLIHPPYCTRCGTPLSGTGVSAAAWCANCLRTGANPSDSPVPRVRSAALHTGSLRRAILNWKYSGRIALSSSLASFLQSRFEIFFPAEEFDCILPVPLHVRRLRRRGFNQCVLLAGPLSKSLGIPLELGSVVRVRNTPSQSGASRGRRHTNLRGAFSVVAARRFAGRSVLILDDVTTTGVTIDTLSRALYTAGARQVSAYTLTRSLETASLPAPPARSTSEFSPPDC